MSNVKVIIDAWDPVNLLLFAPNDEYHSEIANIEKMLESVQDVNILSEEIYKLFLDSFGETVFQKDRLECTQVAEAILAAQ